MNFSNKTSRVFGKIANKAFPHIIQTFINRLYVYVFKIDMSEFEKPCSYKTLNALFTRSLIKPRNTDAKPFNLISPTDSLIMEQGALKDYKALQIKGMEYSVLPFLGLSDTKEIESIKDYKFINLYLSPKDYHRFHAPCDLEVLEAKYFSGRLLPVNKPSLLKNKDLFNINERVVLKVRFSYNKEIAYYVAVGALNVGKMSFSFDVKIKTNAKFGDAIYTYKDCFFKAGDEIGTFEMGSTIVLIANMLFAKDAQDTIKMGQELALLNKNS
ncbi:phosphatidylserine decarboxylase [Helicobacter sp. 13S00401-1]|uniref:phosphatidylserine decarboxylase n=1 Tax=Helicobacter sp. 13S00401-1 TaxID=1905758 RepID=UPI000BA671CD|nr:phosphatidylserine decarboxylase [Helicobacter sp. 13S00401-1]PAF50413.1 phosphatidylserine decarboxylase [Helicobacter sp. 13S00401-1]